MPRPSLAQSGWASPSSSCSSMASARLSRSRSRRTAVRPLRVPSVSLLRIELIDSREVVVVRGLKRHARRGGEGLATCDLQSGSIPPIVECVSNEQPVCELLNFPCAAAVKRAIDSGRGRGERWDRRASTMERAQGRGKRRSPLYCIYSFKLQVAFESVMPVRAGVPAASIVRGRQVT